ncbi:MAG: type I restriction-modification protein subunit S [bacterium]|nr:MAG: type I restriction-modification protein subunit S [bacterium]
MMERYEKYKDSGVEWIGEIPEGWICSKLKFATKKIIDGTHFTPTYVQKGVPFLRVTDIHESLIDLDKVKRISHAEHKQLSNRCNPSKGDVLLSKNGTIGITKVIDWDWEFSIFVSLCLLKFKTLLSGRYFAFFFKSNIVDQQICESSQTTSVTNLHLDKIKELLITLPPRPDQTTIANYLDRKTAEIDELIAQKERLLELYEEEKTAIINQAVTKGIDLDVKLKDSGIDWLGEIPERWEIKKIKYLLKKKRGALKTGPFGSQIKNSDLNPLGKFKVYTQRNVMDSNYITGEDRIDDEKFRSLKEFEIIPNDILFTTRGTIGKCSIFPENMETGILHPCLIRIQIDESLVLPGWIINYVTNSSFFLENVKLESNSTIIDVIYGGTLKEIVIPLPLPKHQSAIVHHIETETARINAKIARTKKIIELQKEYRTALISEVVTGKIKVTQEMG